jgi:DNA uptake protein ComE-like DNA-binding protein
MSFFHFTSSERIGVIALIVISTAIIYFRSIIIKNDIYTIPELSNKRNNIKEHNVVHYPKKSTTQHHYHFFTFDPNVATANDFERMGLSEKQSYCIIHYREKGGHFKTAEDFAKIYSIGASLQQELKPYITIDTTVFQSTKRRSTKINRNSFLSIHLNSATEDELTRLPFIGCSRAHSIVAFRTKIGGFYSVRQLSEIYGITPLMVDSLQGMVTIDTAQLCRININTASISEMKVHPYINYYTAKKIVDYRNTKGVIATPSELVINKIIDSALFRKIAPYISVK